VPSGAGRRLKAASTARRTSWSQPWLQQGELELQRTAEPRRSSRPPSRSRSPSSLGKAAATEAIAFRSRQVSLRPAPRVARSHRHSPQIWRRSSGSRRDQAREPTRAERHPEDRDWSSPTTPRSSPSASACPRREGAKDEIRKQPTRSSRSRPHALSENDFRYLDERYGSGTAVPHFHAAMARRRSATSSAGWTRGAGQVAPRRVRPLRHAAKAIKRLR